MKANSQRRYRKYKKDKLSIDLKQLEKDIHRKQDKEDRKCEQE